MKQSAIFLVVFAILALAAPTASAAKKKGFKIGTYTATGGVSFKFTVTKNDCPHPVTGQNRKGYCFKALHTLATPPATTPVTVNCPENGPHPDFQTSLGLPFDAVISRSGRLKNTASARDISSGLLLSTTELNMTLKTNGHGTGSMKYTQHPIGSPPSPECTSGIVKFSAKRTSRTTIFPRE